MKAKFDNHFAKMKANGKAIQIMSHMVGGFPGISANKELAQAMEEAGSDYVELQLPFSDPLADGSVILKSNHAALEKKFNLEKGFRLIEDLTKLVKTPLFVMTYYNLPFCFGLEKFMKTIVRCGASGVIIPDIPFDDDDQAYTKRMKAFHLHAIMVVSPNTSRIRLKKIAPHASGFVYTSLRTGLTGAKKKLSADGLKEFKKLQGALPPAMPIAAGFGISKKAHVQALYGKADIAVIGSKLISLSSEKGPEAVKKFISSLLD